MASDFSILLHFGKRKAPEDTDYAQNAKVCRIDSDLSPCTVQRYLVGAHVPLARERSAYKRKLSVENESGIDKRWNYESPGSITSVNTPWWRTDSVVRHEGQQQTAGPGRTQRETCSGPLAPSPAKRPRCATPGEREESSVGPVMHPMDQEDLSAMLTSFGRSPSWEKIAETRSGLQEDFTDFNFWRAPLPLLSEDDFKTVEPAPEFNDFNFWRAPLPDVDLSMEMLELPL